ncbi:sulfite exporter TauE/SafE family protein [Pseudoxanthomonas dokdonensis]|uniref:Probable membrane transporter protein n=1 Tax=Pseudoxanthomonas dokdonensis TaxID=344882 RepID=A0A0R0CI48_9GAMM|nr:sulfite exporter TauE/SafE family protein [Pseudoxanthomonas dokdonensis]KRG69596.1 membrane protein [Pseudoxanthomonas dokdonensis]
MEFGSEFYWFIAIGLAAQLVDGALGMAFGLVSSSVLLSLGLPPAAVSASVHAAEVFTTGVSGASHAYFRNIDKRLFWRLAISGSVGGVIGAYVLTRLPGELIRPFVYVYLLALAVLILLRSAGRFLPRGEVRKVRTLGFFAGLMDASGGGGWGPLATSTLLAGGGKARTTIGTVNAAEFVITLAVSITFFFSIGIQHLEIVLGLLIGGVLAAPLAAYLVKHVAERVVLVAVGLLVMSISLYQIGKAWLF